MESYQGRLSAGLGARAGVGTGAVGSLAGGVVPVTRRDGRGCLLGRCRGPWWP